MNNLQKENDILAYTNLISTKVRLIEEFQVELAALTKIRDRLVSDPESTLELIGKEEGFLSDEEVASLARVFIETTLTHMMQSFPVPKNSEDLSENPVNGFGEFLN